MHSIGIVGLGNMGQALSTALSSKVSKLNLWNRSPRKLSNILAELKDDIPSLLEASSTVIVTLSDYAAAFECFSQAPEKLRDKTLVVYCSGLPQEAKEFAEWVRLQGGRTLDGAILGYPTDIGSDRVLMLYSGSKSDFDDISEAVLSKFGPRQEYVGDDYGLAKTYDAVLLCRNYIWMTGYLQSAALASAVGIDVTHFTKTSMELLGPLFGNIERARAEIENGAFREAEQASISVHRAALNNVKKLALSSLPHLPLIDAAYSVLEHGEQFGLGGKEIGACFEVYLKAGDKPAS